MGFGDVKLMGMVGGFLGPKLTLFTIFAGAILGTIFGVIATLAVLKKRIARRKKRQESRVLQRSWTSARLILRHYEIPFGVFLGTVVSLSGFICNQFV